MSQQTKRSGVLRRYPALVLMLAAAALAVLLPSALNVPQSPPTQLSEFAPVPGSGSQGGDVAALGQASDGVGVGRSGRGVDSAASPDQRVGAPSGSKVTVKRCVGTPARQTEDPLSPPCVPFFRGDNGGATGKGVTGDDVIAVLWWEQASDPRPGEMVDCAAAPAADDTPEDTACKAYSAFFNDRYQTYGRRVRLWAYHRPTQPPPGGYMGYIDDTKDPFAVVAVPSTGGSQFAETAGRRKVVGAFYEGAPRSRYSDTSPYLIGFRPDIEDSGRMAATFMCQKLKDRPARYHGSPVERSRMRKFGFFSSGRSELPYREAIESVARGCGIENIPYVEMGVGPTGAANLRDSGVTTIIPLATQGSITTASNNVAQAGWLPEWFLPGDPRVRGYDTNYYARFFNQAQWANAFGLSFDYRRDDASQQMWFRSFKEGCPACGDPTSNFAASMYDTLTMLFYGIQAAGPRLTPANIDRGMHAIPQQGSPNPYKPAAYFSAGNYSFLKDAMQIWWDPSGQPPGDPARGCYRLSEGGARRRASEWRSGDDDIRDASAPCQGSANLGNN